MKIDISKLYEYLKFFNIFLTKYSTLNEMIQLKTTMMQLYQFKIN